jgi:CBS domain-containing protein
VDPYFAELAEFVTDGLEAAGIPRCKGDAMAINPAMRRSVGGWVDALHAWMHDPGSSGSILSSIVYDYRRVTGPLDPEPELEATIHEARYDTAFLSHLGRRTLDHRPPTGFLRDLVVERKGEHVGRLDVKHGGITIVGNIARLEGLRAGIRQGNARSAGRCRGRRHARRERRERASEAFRFLWEVRLRHQAGQVRAGAPPDDFVDPATLGPVTRRGLKEAFGVISRAQQGLATELGLRVP